MDREPLLLLCAPALLTASALALGAANADDHDSRIQRTAQSASAHQAVDVADEMQDAKEQVREATKVVQQMKRDPKLTTLLQRANGVFVGISGIVRDEAENRAYYGQKVTVEQVLSGATKNPDAQMLRDALPDRVAASR